MKKERENEDRAVVTTETGTESGQRMQIHRDQQICRQCGGLCCQGHPGCWVDPRRFAEIFFAGRKFTLNELETRCTTIGLQLRNYSGVPVPAPRSDEAGCVFLAEQGCELGEDQRPCQCLGLIPDIETLITGEIHCRLPGDLSYGTIRETWRRFWKETG